MTEQTQAASGTVAEEAARLIEAMASMARSSTGPREDFSAYAGGPARGSGAADAPDGSEDQKRSSDGVCSSCGGHKDSTPVACKLCPLCQGIAFMRSVRPETVDRLADLASAVASTLRDLATQSRASGPASTAGPASGKTSGAGRTTVQDIHVDDEDEG
ncbi:MAG TPA: hypothetical protein VF317_09675 [Dermatophilaceae bacterium]